MIGINWKAEFDYLEDFFLDRISKKRIEITTDEKTFLKVEIIDIGTVELSKPYGIFRWYTKSKDGTVNSYNFASRREALYDFMEINIKEFLKQFGGT
jgi:hypothetical protein